MNNKLIFPLIFVGAGVMACGGDEARRGDQKAYETVQEGSAAGVTSTIQGPGETLPPITGTNADTTTAFTLDPNAIPPATGAAMPAPGTGSLAGTLPGSPATGYPSAAPAPMTSAATPRPQAQPRSPVTTTPAPRPEPEPAEETPAPTEPSTTTATPPPQQPPPATNTNPQPKPAEKPPADQDDDAEEEPPPPPTTTDTRGGQASQVPRF